MKKKISTFFSMLLVVSLLGTQKVSAQIGDMGFFGGISEGTSLPKTTETLIKEDKNKVNKEEDKKLNYKEVVFLSGTPSVYEGIMKVKTGEMKLKKSVTNKNSKALKDKEPLGTYKETYTIGENEDGAIATEAVILRNLPFNVNYRIEGNQVIKDYEVDTKAWEESITTPGGTYTIDRQQSHIGVSVIEDHMPGITYYRGDISQRLVYRSGANDGNERVISEIYGSFYGYNSAWSSTETHRLNVTITNQYDDWELQYQIRPSVNVSKILQYAKNEPTAISFDGNYKEVMENISGLEYDVFVKPKQFYDMEENGKINIPTYNTFEQLIAPEMAFLKGHFAEADIKKLFAMQVLEGDPKFYLPNQAITRGQYITALVKAVKLPVKKIDDKKTKKNEIEEIIFPDVPKTRPDYPYIKAAYDYGLIVGREGGNLQVDEPIDRQEAIVILIRTLGLQNLGIDPATYTSFTDDYLIANWAKRDIYAAERIGIITGDEDGNFNANALVSKAEAASFINRLIDYMREDLARDYSEYIVNYAD